MTVNQDILASSQKFWKASYQIGFPKIYIEPPEYSNYCKRLSNTEYSEDQERIYTCFDVPGVGKSSLINSICKQIESIYLKVPFYTWAGASRFDSYFNDLYNYLKERNLCSCSTIVPILEDMCRRLLITLFRQAMKEQSKRCVVVMGNGIDLPPVEQWEDLCSPSSDSIQQLLQIVDVFKSQMMEPLNAVTTVLFFDDTQLWAVPLHFKKLSDTDEQYNAEISRKEALNYRIIALSRVLASLPSFIKPVVAGTSDLGKRMTVDSGVKGQQLVMRYSTLNAVRDIIKYYCNIPSYTEDKETEARAQKFFTSLYESLIGPYRLIDHYMFGLQLEFPDSTTLQDMTDFNQVRAKFVRAYTIAFGRYSDKLETHSLTGSRTSICSELLLATLYPKWFGGRWVFYSAIDKSISPIPERYFVEQPNTAEFLTCLEEYWEKIRVVKFDRNLFDSRWYNVQNFGLVRYYHDVEYVYLTMPYPMMLKYWSQFSGNPLSAPNAYYLQIQLLEATTNSGGFTFQLAIAIEFLIATSPLRALISNLFDIPEAELNQVSSLGDIKFYSNVDQISSSGIYIENDNLRYGQGEGDVIICFPSVKLRCSLKADETSTRVNQSFTSFLKNHPDENLLLISYFSFQGTGAGKHQRDFQEEYRRYKGKVHLIEGKNQFSSFIFPFDSCFGSGVRPVNDVTDAINYLYEHVPVMRPLLHKRRREETTKEANKKAKLDVHIRVRKAEKSEGSVSVYIPTNATIEQVMNLVCEELEEQDGQRVSLRTADEYKTKLRRDLKNLTADTLYIALTQDQENIY